MTSSGTAHRLDQTTLDALNSFGTIPRMILGVTELVPDETALIDGNVRMTYAELVGAATDTAGRLRDLGVRPGDRVAILLANGWRYAVAYFGVQLAGGIAVLVNARFTAPEIQHVCDDSASTLLITTDDLIAPDAAPTDHVLVDDVVRAVDPQLGTVLRGALPGLDASSADTCQLLYTSGTTGRPKGVRQTHANLLYNARTVRERLGAAPGESTLVVAPMFHAIGIVSQLVGFTACGATCVILPSFDVGRAVEAVATQRITIFAGVAAMLKLITLHADRVGADLSSLKRIVMGGSPVPDRLVAELLDRLPHVEIANVWGLTEATSIATLTSGADYLDHPGSAGRPVAGVEVWVSTDGGAPRDVRDRVGELCIRGPVVADGYWNNAPASRATFGDGWLRTGDVGMVDADGHVYVLDRLKDMIVRGGENIYSLEVENALSTHPSVAEVAVVGVPDDVMGEIVAAVVVPALDSQPTSEDLLTHLAGHLADYKRPAIFEFVPELPRNASGKVLKRDLGAAIATITGSTR